MKKSTKTICVISLSLILTATELLLIIFLPFGLYIKGDMSKYNYIQTNRLSDSKIVYLYGGYNGEVLTIVENDDENYQVTIPNLASDIFITGDNISYNNKDFKTYELSEHFKLETMFLLNDIIPSTQDSSMWIGFILYLAINLLFVYLLFLSQESISKRKLTIFRRTNPTYAYKIIAIIGILATLASALDIL